MNQVHQFDTMAKRGEYGYLWALVYHKADMTEMPSFITPWIE